MCGRYNQHSSVVARWSYIYIQQRAAAVLHKLAEITNSENYIDITSLHQPRLYQLLTSYKHNHHPPTHHHTNFRFNCRASLFLDGIRFIFIYRYIDMYQGSLQSRKKSVIITHYNSQSFLLFGTSPKEQKSLSGTSPRDQKCLYGTSPRKENDSLGLDVHNVHLVPDNFGTRCS